MAVIQRFLHYPPSESSSSRDARDRFGSIAVGARYKQAGHPVSASKLATEPMVEQNYRLPTV